MNDPVRSTLLRYGGAALAVLLATAARLALDPILGDLFPFATLFLAVLVVAGYAGRGPALLATGLGAAAAARFLLPPRDSLAVRGFENQAGLVLYLTVGAGIALLGGAMRSARRRAEAHAAEAAEKEERLRVTLASIGDAVIATDAEGRVELPQPGRRGADRAGDGRGGGPAARGRLPRSSTRRPAGRSRTRSRGCCGRGASSAWPTTPS